MSLDIDKYLSRSYDLANYNCWHLLREAWLELTGNDLGDRTPDRITKAALVGRFDTDVPAFVELPAPEDPSLMLMTRRGTVPHVGLFYRGRVLQMLSSGASYTIPATACAGFEQVRYFK